MNHIQALTEARDDLQSKSDDTKARINQFRKLLASSKFTGTDSDGDRKDWISVSDVLFQLRILENDLDGVDSFGF